MKRSGRVPWVEVRVGLIILFAFAVLLWAAFKGTGMTVFKKADELHAYFDDVGGLVSGSPVWLGGIEVGHVAGIEFVDLDGVGKVHVAFEVKKDAWALVSDSSRVSVGTMGLMGDKYISLAVRKPGQPGATPGAVLPSSTAGDLTSAFAGAPDMMGQIKESLTHLNATLMRVERGEGIIGRLTSEGETSNQLDSLITSSRRLMEELTASQRRLVAAIENAAGSFDSLSNGILHGGGTLSKLVWDSSLYVELSGMTNRTNALLAKWERGEGTIGKLSSDSLLYVEARGILADTRRLVDDITANPRKYFKFSVF